MDSARQLLEMDINGICILNGSERFSEARALITEACFIGEVDKAIWRQMEAFYTDGSEWDMVSVAFALQGKAEGVNYAYEVTRRTNVNPYDTGAAFMEKCVMLKEAFVAEYGMLVASDMMKAKTLDAMLDAKEKLEKAMEAKATDDWLDMAQVMLALGRHRDKVSDMSILGISTGIRTLDLLTSGLQAGQVITIAARPSVGKSAFMGEIAVNAAKTGKRVGIVSLEMPEEQLGARMLSLYSDIDFQSIYRNRGDADSITKAMVGISDLPIYLSTKTSVTASDIKGKIVQLKKRGGVDMLIIDYLQLIEGEGKGHTIREQVIAKIIRTLKKMAMQQGIPIVVLAQLNRDSEKAGGGRFPKISQIRESGAIEQDSDVVILLHRDWKSGREQNEDGSSTEHEAHLILAKNRNGETKTIDISFEPSTMKFYEASEQKRSDFANGYDRPFAGMMEQTYDDEDLKKQFGGKDDGLPF